MNVCQSIATMLLLAPGADESVIQAPFPQETQQPYVFGDGLPRRTPHGDELVTVEAIALRADGLPVASAVTDLTDIRLIEFDGTRWTLAEPFFEHVTKTPQHESVASRSGRTNFQEKGLIVDKAALTYKDANLVAIEHSVWERFGPGGDFETKRVFEAEDESVLAVAAADSGAAAIGTSGGLYVRGADGEPFDEVYPADEKYSWAPRDVAAVAYDSRGHLWFGSDQGAGVFDGESWQLFTGAEGLPYDHFTCAEGGEDGVIWFGTERGAIRYDGERWAYRASRRWLPDDRVTDIAVDSNGNTWIATKKGISYIERKPMTLESKAEHFIDVTEKRNNRDGYIATWRLEKRGDVMTAVPAITDNDGQYTSMYGAAMTFRYAATGDPEAKRLAKRSFEASKALVDVVPESMKGFPARVLIPADWPELVNEQYGAAFNKKVRENDPHWKLIEPRFPLSEDGKYRWKCDTSSDELAGHYFLYSTYHDLVAKTEAERVPVREVVRDITDHLIRNDFNLVDHDGKPTRWARFGPEYIYGKGGWEQRGLNSLMMLSMLAVAEHVTGDSTYGETAAMLRDEYGYHYNVREPVPFFPPENVVPWDINLALMSFYPLMKYETDPERLLIYRTGLENMWLFVSKQKNPFWSLGYAACAGFFDERAKAGVFDGLELSEYYVERYKRSDFRLDDVLDTLRGIPLELVGWRMPNSHRLDVVLDNTPGQEPGFGWSRVDGKAIPIEERAHVRQDRAPLQIDNVEGDGWTVHEGTIYLLPYYLGRYHGLIR